MKIKYASRLSISEITDIECPRKNIIEILIKIRGIPKNDILNKHTLSGKITHSILQDTLLRDFNLIEYFYFKRGFRLLNSILKTLEINKDYWFSFLNEENDQYPWNRYLDLKTYVMDKVEGSISILGKLSQSLIVERGQSLTNKLIGREFQVNYQIKPSITLVGRIDLLAWEKNNKLRIIEFKSGRKRKSDLSQVYTYYQIISQNFPNVEFQPEIWYIMNNRRATPKLLELPPDRDYLKYIKETFKKAIKVKTESDLPKMYKNSYYCQNICKLCTEYLDSIFQGDTTQPNTLFRYL